MGEVHVNDILATLRGAGVLQTHPPGTVRQDALPILVRPIVEVLFDLAESAAARIRVALADVAIRPDRVIGQAPGGPADALPDAVLVYRVENVPKNFDPSPALFCIHARLVGWHSFFLAILFQETLHFGR